MTYRHDSDIRYNQIIIERRNHGNEHDKVIVEFFTIFVQYKNAIFVNLILAVTLETNLPNEICKPEM